jgi:hypothetical protein
MTATLNDQQKAFEALRACVDVILHDGVPTDKDHPARVALDKAEAVLARQSQHAAVGAQGDDARRMRTLCRLLDAMDDMGNGFPGEVHAAFQDGAKVVRATLDRFATPDDCVEAPLPRASDAPATAQPIATLHDDGHYTWHRAKPHDFNYAGWRMAVYAAPATAAHAGAIYQELGMNGMWMDVSRELYESAMAGKFRTQGVRIVYAAPTPAATAPAALTEQVKDLLDRIEDMRLASKDEGHDTEDSMTLSDAINCIMRLATNPSNSADAGEGS